MLIATNAMKDKFYSIIAHDLRNPFNAIIGFSEVLIGSINDSAQKQVVLTINETAKTAHRLLENLLDWARSQNGNIPFNPELTNVADLVNTAINDTHAQAVLKSIAVLAEIEEGCFICADHNMMISILRNLISNAIKFTPERGEVAIIVKD